MIDNDRHSTTRNIIDNMNITPPNILSASRLAAAPVLAAVFWLPPHFGVSQTATDIAACAVFAVAALTDFIDGYWARKRKLQTRLGEFLDPVADKILVTTALLLLMDAERAPAAACLLIVAREIFVSALREWAAGAGTDAVRVSALGKWKTATQMCAVLLLFIHDTVWQHTPAVGETVLWVAAFLAAWSMIEYSRAAWLAQGKDDV